jgi:hypothetical protein
MEIEITKTFDHLGTTYQAGQKTHVENSIAADFIHHKVAKRVAYKTHKEFMDAHEKQRVADLPSSAAPATGWSIRESTSNDPRVRFVVAETSPLGDITFYDAPPAHAPASVKQKYADAVATDAAAFSSRAEFLAKQAREPRITTGHTETDLATVTFGASGVKRG